ncbi:MAG: chorismate mutase, partial [Spirochaetae bacterium HGW-Spirochaetae-8]
MSEERLRAVRGAIQVSSDDALIIEDAVRRLCGKLFDQNQLITNESAVSIMFTQTNDLTALNPATALRKAFPTVRIPLFCMQEPSIVGMLPMTIRIMIQFYAPDEEPIQHVY